MNTTYSLQAYSIDGSSARSALHDQINITYSLQAYFKSATRCFIYLFWGSVTLSTYKHRHYNESVHRKKQHTHGNNTIPCKLATLVTFETLKWKYTVVTNVLIVTRDESPLVYRVPESASEHSHFGTFHIGTSMVRDCTTTLFQVTMSRQFARKVGPSTNSALIRYYLLI